MTMSVAVPAKAQGAARVPLVLYVGAGVYALLLLSGDRLLIDPDTLWQVTVGQWIVDHRAVPVTDVYSFTMRGQPWISTQWLAQVSYAMAYAVAGWAGPVALAASAIAATFALLARELRRHFDDGVTLVCVAAALALTLPHMLARPHVLAMPVMLLWVGGLVSAMDRRAAPSFGLLPLMTLWANLHGGFVFGLALLAPFGLDAAWGAERSSRKSLVLRWAAFSVAAFAASCVTPYGWNALLASQKILGLGGALPLIREWAAADFSSLGAFEISILLASGLALYRGVKLPPLRIAMLLVLLHMALSHGRSVEILVLLAPLILATPLSQQFGGAGLAHVPAKWNPVRRQGHAPKVNLGCFPVHMGSPSDPIWTGTALEGGAAGQDRRSPSSAVLIAGLAACLLVGTFAFASVHRFAPYAGSSPVAAVAELKKYGFSRVCNDYDFGGYLIASGVAPFIDGRTELYGEKFFVDHNNASGLMEPENLFRLLKDYDIEATLMRTQSAATKLLDHMDGWQKVYSDDIATIHVRKADAARTADPAISPAAH